MRRKNNIQDAFKSVVPEGTAGVWSVGYSGHTDETAFLDYPEFEVTAVRVVDSPVAVTNDVYVDYSYLSGVTMTGTTSIYTY
jgi:hypothetical protein